jgi:hypothetical protein
MIEHLVPLTEAHKGETVWFRPSAITSAQVERSGPLDNRPEPKWYTKLIVDRHTYVVLGAPREVLEKLGLVPRVPPKEKW